MEVVIHGQLKTRDLYFPFGGVVTLQLKISCNNFHFKSFKFNVKKKIKRKLFSVKFQHRQEAILCIRL